MIKSYYALAKPGIIYGNAITVAAGFFLASKGNINFWLLLVTLTGISLVIASACVFNNYIDRDIDSLMVRTKKRALVTGLISVRDAMLYATFLGLAGFLVLAVYSNLLTVFVVLAGFVDYVIFYGIFKRRSVYGTIVGSIAGATPIVAGYTAVSNQFDAGAVILFLILVFWQMPHFYAIGIYRSDDYQAAQLPILPIKEGIQKTKIHILLYIVAFTIAAAMLTVFGFTGYIYLITVLSLSLAWLWLGIKGFKADNDKRWARKMFLFSLVLLLSVSALMSAGILLP